MEDEFGVDPESDAVEASDPSGKRGESAAVIGQRGEAAFDAIAECVEFTAERRAQQFQRAESGRAVSAVA